MLEELPAEVIEDLNNQAKTLLLPRNSPGNLKVFVMFIHAFVLTPIKLYGKPPSDIHNAKKNITNESVIACLTNAAEDLMEHYEKVPEKVEGIRRNLKKLTKESREIIDQLPEFPAENNTPIITEKLILAFSVLPCIIFRDIFFKGTAVLTETEIKELCDFIVKLLLANKELAINELFNYEIDILVSRIYNAIAFEIFPLLQAAINNNNQLVLVEIIGFISKDSKKHGKNSSVITAAMDAAKKDIHKGRIFIIKKFPVLFTLYHVPDQNFENIKGIERLNIGEDISETMLSVFKGEQKFIDFSKEKTGYIADKWTLLILVFWIIKEGNFQISSLDLSDHGIGNADQTLELLHIIIANFRLPEIIIFGNNLQSRGAIAVADAARANKYLQHLDMNDNDIGETGLTAIAYVMEDHPTLYSVNLRLNSFTLRSIMAIANAIHQNSRLTISPIAETHRLYPILATGLGLNKAIRNNSRIIWHKQPSSLPLAQNMNGFHTPPQPARAHLVDENNSDKTTKLSSLSSLTDSESIDSFPLEEITVSFTPQGQ